MLAFTELHEVQRRLQNRKVLSVFVDTSGPADGPSWRAKLDRALASLDARPPLLSSGERTARELCVAHLRTALESLRGTPGEPGWVAYVTTDDVVAAWPLHRPVETAVFWQSGIVMAPLLETVVKRTEMATLASQRRFALQRLTESRPLVRNHAPRA
ncbi:MAG TPA: hypothetical protein VJ802_02375 [Gemmatimonadaceae bacterium]|nr:hypothetical protein [Gemmatimonadaceae bacterium]